MKQNENGESVGSIGSIGLIALRIRLCISELPEIILQCHEDFPPTNKNFKIMNLTLKKLDLFDQKVAGNRRLKARMKRLKAQNLVNHGF